MASIIQPVFIDTDNVMEIKTLSLYLMTILISSFPFKPQDSLSMLGEFYLFLGI